MSNGAHCYRPRLVRAWLFTKENAGNAPDFVHWHLNRWPGIGGLRFSMLGTQDNNDGFWATNAHLVYIGPNGAERWIERTYIIDGSPLRFMPEKAFDEQYELVE